MVGGQITPLLRVLLRVRGWEKTGISKTSVVEEMDIQSGNCKQGDGMPVRRVL